MRFPSPEKDGGCTYEDALTGGKIFAMYCSYCHNAPSLAERPYAQFRNVAAHIRVRANLTGKEYAKLMEFLRRWNDIPPPSPPVAPTPNRMIFSQPMSELKPEEPKQAAPGNAKPAGKEGEKIEPEVLPKPKPVGIMNQDKSARPAAGLPPMPTPVGMGQVNPPRTLADVQAMPKPARNMDQVKAPSSPAEHTPGHSPQPGDVLPDIGTVPVDMPNRAPPRWLGPQPQAPVPN